MTAFYDRLNSTADRLIAKFGKQYTFTTETLGDYDNATRSRPSTTSTYTAKAVVTSISKSDRSEFALKEDDIGLIAESADYKRGDTVTVNGEIAKVYRKRPINPAGTEVAVNVFLRK